MTTLATDPIVKPVAHHRFPASFADVVLHAERHRVTSGSVWLHIHPEWELAMVQCPSGTTVVGGSDFQFAGTELVLIPGGIPHRWLLGSADAAETATFDILAFTPESLGGTLLSRREYRALRELIHSARRGLRWNEAVTARVAREIQLATESIGLPRVAHALLVLATLAECTTLQPVLPEDFERSPYAHEISTLEEVVSHTLAHTHGHVPVGEAAARARVSESTLERMCHRITGTSFVTYITTRRIARTAELLRSTDRPVSAIAEQSGFSNLSHFNRMFRRHIGVAPREFRREGRSNG